MMVAMSISFVLGVATTDIPPWRTKITKRQDNTDNFYTTSLTFLCNFCIKKAREDDEEEKEKDADVNLP